MTRKFIYGLVILALLCASIGTSTAQAAFAYNVDFTTWITYQNMGSTSTTSLAIMLYRNPSDTNPLVVSQPNLAKDASTSVSVGSLTSGSFEGTAIMAADQPLAATLVQLPPAVTAEPLARNRPMSNGFSAGTSSVMIASVNKRLGNPQQITKFSVQNAGTGSTLATIQFFGNTSTALHTINQTLAPGAGVYIDAAAIAQLPNGFSGSAVISTTGGSIVASAMELDSANYGSKAFEGVGSGAGTVYMPSALCNYNSGGGVIQTSYYAVQNTGGANANITVTWSNGNTVTKSNIAPFTKATFAGCEGGNPNGFTGSATISSNQPVIALGKVNGGGLSTAFMGFTAGAQKVAVPYVRWPTDQRFFQGTMQRANLAIQNVGGSTITGAITVKYINPDGSLAGTHTINTDVAPGGKVNSNPTNASLSTFGCYNNCTTYGGGAIVEGPAGSQLAVIARLVTYVPANGQRMGEDLSGIPYP